MLRALKVIAIFALAVPPLSGVVAAMLIAVFWLATEGATSDGGTPLLQQSLIMAAYALPMSYVIGGAQALFVGIGSAGWVAWKHKLPLIVPLALSLLAWVAFSVMISSAWHGTGQSLSEVALSGNGALLLAVHLFAGALGWWLAGRSL